MGDQLQWSPQWVLHQVDHLLLGSTTVLNKDLPIMFGRKTKMMKLCNPLQCCFHCMVIKKGAPIIHLHYCAALLRPNQLCNIGSCGMVHSANYIIEATNLGESVLALKKTKAPVRGKLCMPHWKKGNSDLPVKPCQHSPHQIVHQITILVLPTAVIRMEMDRGFPESVSTKEVVEHRNNDVASFSHVRSLINEVSDLNVKDFYFLTCMVTYW